MTFLSRNKCKYVDNCDLVELIDYKEGRDSYGNLSFKLVSKLARAACAEL
jgi:hypothetical protein